MYLVKRGVVRAELEKPTSSWQRLKMKRLVDDIFSSPEKPTTRIPTHEIEELLLLSSWFRRFPGEMGQTRQVS